MKKIFFSVLALFATTLVIADPIDLVKAKSIATRFMDEGVSPELVETAVSKKRTLSGNPPLYIFNRGNEKGFVIVSGDDSMPKIIGYTEEGHFDASKLAPALLEMLEGYSNLVIEAQANGAGPRPTKRAVTGRKDIPTMVSARWGQGWPYNMYAPHRTDNGAQALTGCVATAAAQVVHYWAKENPYFTQQTTPTYGYGGAPVTVSFEKGTPLRWELMQSYHNNSLPTDMNEAVATLMYVIGTSTWLTYADGTGTATSGQISNLVGTFGGQFNLKSQCTYKWNYSQADWENLIYSDLKKGWPIVYSGVHPSNGGHAIVLDGYRAADNLFHFNFGWDGGSDGYYTVDDNNGVNGFSQSQGMTHGIHPSRQLLQATIHTDTLCIRMKNNIEIEITNNGTTDYSGIYLLGSRKVENPTSLDKISDKNLETIIKSGETATITLQYNPPILGTSYLYVMDANANILATAEVPSIEQMPALSLENFAIANSIETTNENITVNGGTEKITYNKVYADNTYPVATICNSANATASIPNIQCDIYAYDATQGAFIIKEETSERETYINKGETLDFAFGIENLEYDVLYAAQLHRSYRAGTEILSIENKVDTIVYFKLYPSDITISSTTDHCYSVKGHWNKETFEALTAEHHAYYYDMKEVIGFNSIPKCNNPNTLFYVEASCDFDGKNVIKDNNCSDLQLTAGYDFQPIDDFTAQVATFNPNTTDMLWKYIVLPFDCDVPNGSRARKISKLSGTLVTKSDSVNTELKACIPYLYRTTLPGEDRFMAYHVTVSTKALTENTDTLCGTFINKKIGESQRKLNKANPQIFTTSKGGTLNAFEGYLNYSQDINTKIYSYSAKDEISEDLATSINAAHDFIKTKSNLMTTENLETLQTLLADAEECYTRQPIVTEIEEMIALLSDEIIACKKNAVSDGEPIDMTDLIENPSFENKKTTGWTVNKATGQRSSVVENTSLENLMVGADAAYTYYTYSTTGKGSASISQEINGLSNGYYRVTASIATDEGKSVTMFADDKTATMTDNGLGKRYLVETVVDSVHVTDGTINIGVMGNEGWYKVDNFRLYYLGGNATSIHQTEISQPELNVWSNGGILYITSTTNKDINVCIYTIDGKLIEKTIVNGHKQIAGLPKGIYIVNRQKVVIQ